LGLDDGHDLPAIYEKLANTGEELAVSRIVPLVVNRWRWHRQPAVMTLLTIFGDLGGMGLYSDP